MAGEATGRIVTRLDGKVAIVTGAARGLGRAIAVRSYIMLSRYLVHILHILYIYNTKKDHNMSHQPKWKRLLLVL